VLEARRPDRVPLSDRHERLPQAESACCARRPSRSRLSPGACAVGEIDEQQDGRGARGLTPRQRAALILTDVLITRARSRTGARCYRRHSARARPRTREPHDVEWVSGHERDKDLLERVGERFTFRTTCSSASSADACANAGTSASRRVRSGSRSSWRRSDRNERRVVTAARPRWFRRDVTGPAGQDRRRQDRRLRRALSDRRWRSWPALKECRSGFATPASPG
jgi:hypothetical protein